MNFVLLTRAYSSGADIIWLFIIGLLITALGGRWLGQKIILWVHQRKVQHLWPFK